MKTLQELYEEIRTSDELKAAFAEAAKAGKAVEFVREHGCDATEDELKAFLEERAGALSDEELDNAAGGGCNMITGCEVGISALSAGVFCALGAILSAAIPQAYVGQKIEGDGRICNPNT